MIYNCYNLSCVLLYSTFLQLINYFEHRSRANSIHFNIYKTIIKIHIFLYYHEATTCVHHNRSYDFHIIYLSVINYDFSHHSWALIWVIVAFVSDHMILFLFTSSKSDQLILRNIQKRSSFFHHSRAIKWFFTSFKSGQQVFIYIHTGAIIWSITEFKSDHLIFFF